ncbi:hypothetical protein [Streptomyces sp. ODS28]|uniref:hypothetical protein n=1 Tax=Streptomyces sp. ODS28 TaxID=3136688 RepID=UPI0031E70E2A
MTALAGVLLAGCTASDGLRDNGPASKVSAPPTPSPVWPDLPTPSPSGEEWDAGGPFDVVPGVRAPDGDLRKVPARDLLAADRNPTVEGMLRKCHDGPCRLRKPVYRDLTGDGRDELVLGYAGPGNRILVEVYRAEGSKVRPVLLHWGEPGLTAETVGRDLVLREVLYGEVSAARYRWNGTIMSHVSTESRQGPAARPPSR